MHASLPTYRVGSGSVDVVMRRVDRIDMHERTFDVVAPAHWFRELSVPSNRFQAHRGPGLFAECVFVLESFYELERAHVAELVRSGIALPGIHSLDGRQHVGTRPGRPRPLVARGTTTLVEPVLPAATEGLTLLVHYNDGSVSRGESTARGAERAVSFVTAMPEGARAPEAVISAIREADLIVLSPGSLFTSTIAALLGGGVRETLGEFTGPIVYAAKLMTQPGETHGFTVSDHLRAITRHVGPIVTDVLVDAEPVPIPLQRRYLEEGAEPVPVDGDAIAALGVRQHEAAIHSTTSGHQLRHDPDRLARGVLALISHRR